MTTTVDAQVNGALSEVDLEWRGCAGLEPTKEMMDAGVEAFCEMRLGSSPSDVVERVWLAMVSEAPKAALPAAGWMP